MKRVALDIGNVICQVYLDRFYNAMIQHKLVEQMKEAEAFVDGIQGPQDVGLYTVTQAIRRFYPSVTLAQLDYLHDAWMSTIEISKPAAKMIESLIDEGFTVALLSNMGRDHMNYITKQSFADDCIQWFSCKVGARKPTALYYQSFLLQYDWKNVPFFDDRLENVEAAVDMGLNGKLFSILDFPSEESAALELRRQIYMYA